MNRCLHITIHESPGAASRRAASYGPGQSGFDPAPNHVMPPIDDPASNHVMPPIDDPASNHVMPPIDDPASNHVMPPIDDPTSGPYSSGGHYYGHPGVTVHECGCAASPGPRPAAGSGDTALPDPFVTPRDYSGFVIVRMAEGVSHDSAGTLWDLAEGHNPKLTGLQEVLAMAVEAEEGEPGTELSATPEAPSGILASRRLAEIQGMVQEEYAPPTPVPLPRDKSLARIRELEKMAAATAFPPLHSLTSYWRLDLRKRPDLVEKVVTGLNRLEEVDLAYLEVAAGDPHLPTTAGKSFTEDQGYLDHAPVGISACWVWENLNGTASSVPKVTLCDLEQGWNTGHVELTSHVPSNPFFGANRASEGHSGHHGTAVLGQLAAMGQRIKGAAADLGQFVLASHYRSKTEPDLPGTNGHVADAILQALPKPKVEPGEIPSFGTLTEGSILLLEVQRGLLPTEIDEADFDAIRLASALGVIVVEAAGNGGFNLDAWTHPATGRSLRRGAPGFHDSGAILVGAARAGLPHDRAPFSNYGSRVDCFGWGEGVTTSGYGDLSGTVDTDLYTNAFSGTSSASPIIAGAAALVQALHKDRAGFPLDPRMMRALLSDPATGTRQGPNVAGHIGVMPDLEAIVQRRLQLVPDVYMRRCVGDHDSKRDRGEEISSSPDIVLWTGDSAEASARFGEGLRANDPAPGSPIDAGAPAAIYSSSAPISNLYVRLRNRGLGEGKAKVHLFASPAAPLITPERWLPVDSVDVTSIPQGDSLTVSGPVLVNLPPKWSFPESSEWNGTVPPFSFLAVQISGAEENGLSHAPGFERTVLLPPGPPYFDWTRYRSFLRGPGVTWRNVHPIQVSAEMTLAFLLAGTPDQTRHFDFEVIQRLPDRVKVTLKVPDALAAKLRQRRPWLGNGDGELLLPHRPRTALGRVALAPGSCAHAAFHVKVEAPSALLPGHSLAIRQLWRGEEVGRITWWFVKKEEEGEEE